MRLRDTLLMSTTTYVFMSNICYGYPLEAPRRGAKSYIDGMICKKDIVLILISS